MNTGAQGSTWCTADRSRERRSAAHFRSSFAVLLLTGWSCSLSAQTWNEIIEATASDRAANDNFGMSVAISGDYAIVGSPGDDEDASGGNTAANAGSAYIFVRSGGVWTQQQKIVASDRAAGDLFWKVAISGDRAIVGASGEDEDASGGNTLPGAGNSAYVFTRNGSVWTEQQKIVASDRGGAPNDNFGREVAISGDYLVVTAPGDDEDASGGNAASNAGSAYLFMWDGGSWIEMQKIVASDRAAVDGFGSSVSMSGDDAIVGAPLEDEDASGTHTHLQAGSAYVFTRSGATWIQQQKIVASDRADNDQFGVSVSISGGYAVVGAHLEDEDASGGNTAGQAGSAYIFFRSGGSWVQQQKIVAGDRGAGDLFGAGVAIAGDHVIVGAYGDDQDASGGNTSTDAGSAYIFQRNGSTWAQQQKIAASDRQVFDQFGYGVAISGDAIVGAWGQDEDIAGLNTAADAGSVYFFHTQDQVVLDLKLWLEGPLVIGAPTLMGDALRTAALIPLMEPYTGLGFVQAGGGGGEMAPPGVFSAGGSNAIVDWVRIELRSNADPTAILVTSQCLVQRDGDVVSATDGVSPVILHVTPGSYYVAVRHRDHLGCMTNAPVALNASATTIDFRTPATITYGVQGRKNISGVMALWAGNTLRDVPGPFKLTYTNLNNDRDPILLAVGGVVPTNTAAGYLETDLNMDGVVKYTGFGNDRDLILFNIGGTVPTTTRTEQLP